MANEAEIDINLARRLRGSGLPSQPVLEINPPAPAGPSGSTREPADPHLAEWAHVLFDQAVLTLARITEPAAFVGRLNDLLVSLSAASHGGSVPGRWRPGPGGHA